MLNSQGGKADTEERSQQQQHQGYVAGDSEQHRLQKQERPHYVRAHVTRWAAYWPHFDLLNKESAIKSALPPEDLPLSVSAETVRRILLRVNMSKSAWPDNLAVH